MAIDNAVTLRKATYDAITLLTKSKVSIDSRIEEDYIMYKLNGKRSKELRDTYNRNGVIEPIWIQNMGLTNLTEINTADDKSLSVCDCKFKKMVLPSVVSFGNNMGGGSDLGVVSIRTACRTKEYYPTQIGRFMDIPKGHIESKFKYYIKEGNSYFLTDHKQTQCYPSLVLEDPLNGFVFDTTNIPSGDLVVGTSYTVMDAQIVHNSLGYNPGQTFTAVNTVYTGQGTVQYTLQKRVFTWDDPYPMSFTMMDAMIMRLLMEDYKLEQSVIADLKNDSRDELQLINANVA